jgi:chitinase
MSSSHRSYDIWGSWSPTVGPHSALNDTCAPKASRAGSAVSAMAAWGAVRRSRIVLGVPAYGRSWTVPKNEAYVNGKSGTLKLFAKPDKRRPPKGDVWDDAPGKDVCGTKTGPGGVWTFQGLVKDGFLTKKGIPAKGIDHRYDTCSQTVCSHVS